MLVAERYSEFLQGNWVHLKIFMIWHSFSHS